MLAAITIRLFSCEAAVPGLDPRSEFAPAAPFVIYDESNEHKSWQIVHLMDKTAKSFAHLDFATFEVSSTCCNPWRLNTVVLSTKITFANVVTELGRDPTCSMIPIRSLHPDSA